MYKRNYKRKYLLRIKKHEEFQTKQTEEEKKKSFFTLNKHTNIMLSAKLGAMIYEERNRNIKYFSEKPFTFAIND